MRFSLSLATWQFCSWLLRCAAKRWQEMHCTQDGLRTQRTQDTGFLLLSNTTQHTSRPPCLGSLAMLFPGTPLHMTLPRGSLPLKLPDLHSVMPLNPSAVHGCLQKERLPLSPRAAQPPNTLPLLPDRVPGPVSWVPAADSHIVTHAARALQLPTGPSVPPPAQRSHRTRASPQGTRPTGSAAPPHRRSA